MQRLGCSLQMGYKFWNFARVGDLNEKTFRVWSSLRFQVTFKELHKHHIQLIHLGYMAT
jgi:hypothetical protein